METRYQITHNGLPFCEPVGVAQKNAILHALQGCANVEVRPVQVEDKPRIWVIEGGKK